MPRTYKPRPKITRECACGCGRTVVGPANRMYYAPNCAVRAHRARKASARR